jgi:hypothetical protein
VSSDNFWFVEGNNVYMGDASDFAWFMEQAADKAERKYRERVMRKHEPYHTAEDPDTAREWAMDEYAEYGVYWIDGK